MESRFFIVFCSPAGSTRHVAEVIERELTTLGAETHKLDLGREHDWSRALDLIRVAGQKLCLFVGSPVYRDQAVTPVAQFLEALPNLDGGFAAPFVTWGGASSGIALWQMGRSLTQKGLILAGAAKVLGVHSLLWSSESPLGQGHPDGDDDMAVRRLVHEVFSRVEDGKNDGLPLTALDYQPAERAIELKENLTGPRPVTPRSVNEAKCNQCQTCINECPADAITLDPYPQFGTDCFDCFNCIRLCPEHAIEPKITLAQLEERIRNRAETMREHPYTQIFI
jgi:ferredoxin/flavodoxin